jgi:hypothetical protein
MGVNRLSVNTDKSRHPGVGHMDGLNQTDSFKPHPQFKANVNRYVDQEEARGYSGQRHRPSPGFCQGLGSEHQTSSQRGAWGDSETTYEHDSTRAQNRPPSSPYFGGMTSYYGRNLSQHLAAPREFPGIENYTNNQRSQRSSTSATSYSGMTASQPMPQRCRQGSPNNVGETPSRSRNNRASPQFSDMDYVDDEDEEDSPRTPYHPQNSRGHNSRVPQEVRYEDHFPTPEANVTDSVSPTLFLPNDDGESYPPSRPYRISKRTRGQGNATRDSSRFSHDDNDNLDRSQSRHPARPPVERNIGRNLEHSRFSGAEMPWGVNQDPPLTRHDAVSDASLEKRDLKRGQGNKVCKRGYGANDPENIAIVNMKEKDNMPFQVIADELNKKRVKEGRPPTLSVCGVAGRYNRTAPLLFASQGKTFVPLSQRNKGKNTDHGDPVSELKSMDNSDWNGDYDLILVRAFKEYEGDRWRFIADIFSEKTGLHVTADQIALRHSIL